MERHNSRVSRRVDHVLAGLRRGRKTRRLETWRRPRFNGGVEPLEARTVLAATVSGTVFQMLDVAGLYQAPQSGSFLSPVSGVTISLDQGAQTQNSQTDGSYGFSNVAPGPHTVSVQLPSGFLGFSAQSLSDNLVVQPSATSFPNLNFALTPKNQALVQNLYELVLSRPADLNGFNQQVGVLNGGGSVGQVFKNLDSSAEFQAESQPVANLLEAFFRGPLDVGAFRNSVQLQNLGISQDATVQQILDSQPFVAKYGDTSLLSNTAYVRFMYEKLLNRTPKPRELGMWVMLLNQGQADRGDVPLSLVESREFRARKPDIARRVAVSLEYLGVLGRQVQPGELSMWMARLRTGTTVKQMANALARSAEFQSLKGFTDTFVWDVMADQIAPAVNPLNRLAEYDPKTQQFDIPVTTGSITSTAANPHNVYFLVHGWAPGLTQSVLLDSTPGDPLKWWDTSDSPWLLNGVPPVSTEGLAQSIVAADPLAVVVAYSWIDQSATPAGSTATVTGKRVAGRAVVTGVNPTNLLPGMGVSGPGIAAGTYIAAINARKRTVTLSTTSTATIAGSLSVDTSQFTIPGVSISSGSAVVTGVNTSNLIAGMTVAGPGMPSLTTVASIDSPTQLTLSANATTSGSVALTFAGIKVTLLDQQGTTNGSAVITGLDTSRLTIGMTVTGAGIPFGDSILSITGPHQVTLAQNATGSGTVPLAFKGEDVGTIVKQNLYAGQSESYTQLNGLELASAIQQALAPGFFTYGSSNGAGLIHLMGHSHGSKVATVAALALQQANVPVAQLTPLESPEGGPAESVLGTTISTHLPSVGGAENYLWYYLQQMNISKTSVGSNRSSTNSTFVDNDYSYQGLGSALGGFNLSAFGNGSNDLSSIVDVELHPELLYGGISPTNPTGVLGTLLGSHGYPPPWYGQTGVQPSLPQPIGLNWSPLLNPANAPAQNFYQQPTSITQTGNLTQGSAVVTNVDTTGLVAGMPVTDQAVFFHDIPDGTTIHSIDSPTQLTLSQEATGTSQATLIFTYTTAQYVSNQYTLQPGTRPTATPSVQTLQYAQQYTVGTVNDTGSSITLSVGANSPDAIDAITFNPLAAQGISSLGAGMDFQVAFNGAAPGQHVELVVWIQGLAAAPLVINPNNPFGPYLNTGTTLGSLSIPLFTMDGADAGTQPMGATISLGGFLASSFLAAPFNAVNNGKPTTIIPTLGFTLIGDATSTVSVTVSAMQQFAIGTGPS